jgi:hypothetical protein
MKEMLHRLDEISRRDLMTAAAKTCLGVSILPIGNALAHAAPAKTGKAKQVIYLFMNGAMSQLDTLDPKPKSKVQGDTGVIRTKIPGVQFGEHFTNLAAMANQLAVVRSMTTTTGAHAPGRYLMRTSYKKLATTRHPGMGAWIQKLAGRISRELPPTVQVGGGQGAGYLGAQFAPVPIGDPSKGLQHTKSPGYLSNSQFDKRISLSAAFDRGFRSKAKGSKVNGYDDLYRDAIRLLRSKDLKAFDISLEPEKSKQAYGDTKFGKGCLLARRLIENGVRFVEVSFGGWDHHNSLFEKLPPKAQELDKVLSTLLTDLQASGRLDQTLVVLGTEFGRKPKPNQNSGRDHHPAAFSTLLAGGGIRGGQVYGATDSDAFYVEEDEVSAGDFNATIAAALGLSHTKEIHSPDGRPFTIGNGGKPLTKLF